MIEILGVKYLNEKEASKRYGYSIHWFKKRRMDKLPPFYVKTGRILYDLEQTDRWFIEQLKIKS